MCICDTSKNFGEFCQFKQQNNTFNIRQEISIILANGQTTVPFNTEIKPCLAKTWQLANPHICNY